jgi:cephalosporin hydroxylase
VELFPLLGNVLSDRSEAVIVDKYSEQRLKKWLRIMISLDAIIGILKEKSNIQVHSVLNINDRLLEVNKWNVSAFLIKRVISIVGITPFPLDELMLMVSVCVVFKPELIIEWGTNVGKSARIFYEIVKYYKIKSEILSIDLPTEIKHLENIKSRRAKFVKRKNVSLYLGDGSEEASKIVDKRKQSLKGFVLYFLDGDHSFDTVSRELTTLYNLYPKVLFLIHDTFFQKECSHYNVGPHRAIAWFLSTHKEWRSLSCNLGLPGMTFLFKDSYTK